MARRRRSRTKTVLPEIAVTNTRLVGGARGARRGAAPGSGADVGTEAPADSAGASGIVTGTIITGASSTVITAQEIERSPGQTLQDLLAREPGVQMRNLFGMVNGASTSVDMRGFGAAGTSNTLVLVNGRRLNDIDMAGVDFSAIPKNSIERIEITRGNSGAVLYGDGAVGGVINIVTKNAVGLPPSARVQAGFGSFNFMEGNLSANTSSGPFSASVFSNAIRSDGYRENNKLRQENAVGDFRWTNGTDSTAYFNISGDNQHLGLPGGRRVTLTTSELVTNRRGAATPFDFAEKQGINAHARHDPDAVAGHRTRRGRRHPPQISGVGFLQCVRARFQFRLQGQSDVAVGHAAAPEPARDRRCAGQADHRHRRLSFDVRFRPQPAFGRSADPPIRPEADDRRVLLPGDGRAAHRHRHLLRRARAAQFDRRKRPLGSECAGRTVRGSARAALRCQRGAVRLAHGRGASGYAASRVFRADGAQLPRAQCRRTRGELSFRRADGL